MKRIIQLTILAAVALSFGACASHDDTMHTQTTSSSSTGYGK